MKNSAQGVTAMAAHINQYKGKRVHMLGIGGSSMSGLAFLLKEKGYIVSGSDMKQSETTDHLISHGAKIYFEHSAENIEGADLICYSAAVSKENPELKAAIEQGIPTATRAEALGALMSGYENSIAITDGDPIILTDVNIR